MVIPLDSLDAQGGSVVAASRGVCLKAPCGTLILGMLVCGVATIALALTRDPLDLPLVMWISIALLGFAALGLGQSWYWWRSHGGYNFVVTESSLQFRSGVSVIAAWDREAVTNIRLQGYFGWDSLLTAAPVDDFPRLEVWTADGKFVSPSILLWAGEARTQEARLREWRAG